MSPRDWRNTRVLVLRWDTMLPAVRYNDLMQNGEAYGHAGIEARIGAQATVLDVVITKEGIAILYER